MKSGTGKPPKVIGVFAYEGVTALDLVGPMEAFNCVEVDGPKGKEKGYEVVVLGLSTHPVTAESGLMIQPHVALQDAPHFDTLIIPGGNGLRNPATMKAVVLWLRRRAEKTRRVASVCTGIYALAATGLLDGRRVVTHWRFARDVAAHYPNVKMEPNALFLKDGKFYTSGGITASIDLALALIEEDYGPTISLTVARELVMHLRRAGGQDQYSEPLQLQVQSSDRFGDVLAWLLGNLDKDLTIDALSRRAGVCPRHFNRIFKAAHGQTPATYVENLRLSEACRQLTNTRITVDQLASAIGFRSADAFRRAFQKKMGVAPTSYRHCFGTQRAINNVPEKERTVPREPG